MSASLAACTPSCGASDADHAFQDHRMGCVKAEDGGCECWTDLIVAQHYMDGRVCWCRPQSIQVLGTDRHFVVHRRMEC